MPFSLLFTVFLGGSMMRPLPAPKMCPKTLCASICTSPAGHDVCNCSLRHAGFLAKVKGVAADLACPPGPARGYRFRLVASCDTCPI